MRPVFTDIRDVGILKPGSKPYRDATTCAFVIDVKGLKHCGLPATRGHYCDEHGARMYAGVPVLKKKAEA